MASTGLRTTRWWHGSRSIGQTSGSLARDSTNRLTSGLLRHWTVIVDTIDGTRGLMYDKRSAWCLAAAAPSEGSLADIEVGRHDRVAHIETGCRRPGERQAGGGLLAERIDLGKGLGCSSTRPSSATDLDHSFSGLAKFFLPGKARTGSARS